LGFVIKIINSLNNDKDDDILEFLWYLVEKNVKSEFVQLKSNIEASVGETIVVAAKCFYMGKAARR